VALFAPRFRPVKGEKEKRKGRRGEKKGGRDFFGYRAMFPRKRGERKGGERGQRPGTRAALSSEEKGEGKRGEQETRFGRSKTNRDSHGIRKKKKGGEEGDRKENYRTPFLPAVKGRRKGGGGGGGGGGKVE